MTARVPPCLPFPTLAGGCQVMMLRLAEGLGLPLGPDDFADYARAMEAARIPLGGPPPDSSEWEGGDELPLPSRPLLGFGVFEFRQGLDILLGRSGEDNL